MNDISLRQELIRVCQRLDALGFVAATDGNVSARLSKDAILITPSMEAKGGLEPEQLLVVGMDGKVRAGAGRPSSEMKMHLAVYWLRPDVNAVVHAHPPVATGFASSGLDLTEPVLPEMVLTVGAVPLAPYATPSTEEVPRSIERLVAKYNAVLLANHGVLALGKDLTEALHRMERVEHLAKVVLVGKLAGNLKVLDKEEMGKLKELAKQMGV